MKIFSIPWEEKLPPDFINEKGIKWWLDKDLTHYARHKLKTDASVWFIEELNGKKSRLLIENNEILYSDTTYEGISGYIEILCISRTN